MLFILLSMFMVHSLLAKQQSVVTQDKTSIFLTHEGKKQEGYLDIATPLILLEENNGFAKVQLTGWSAEGSETVIFRGMGERVLFALFNDETPLKSKTLQSKMDDFDTTWNKTVISFWVNKKDITANISALTQEGKTLFDTRCGACHATPELNHFTVNQWPGIIKSMKARAGLEKRDLQLVIKYVQNNSH